MARPSPPPGGRGFRGLGRRGQSTVPLSAGRRGALDQGAPGWQRLVDLGDPRELTRKGEEARSRLPLEPLWRDVERLYSTGLHPAIGLTIMHKGEVVLDRTVGHVENVPGGVTGEIATTDTLFNLFSASKILTAVVIHSLIEEGALKLDARVADFIPAFGRHGKDAIRVHHLLSHTAGIPNMPPVDDPLAMLATGTLPIDALCEMEPLTPPGLNVAYHPMTSWLLLTEILRLSTGKDLRQLAQERVLGPLGFEHLSYGVRAEDIPLVGKHVRTGPAVPEMMNTIFKRTIGLDVETAVEVSNSPTFLTGILPSANVIGTGRETVRFLQLLLNGGVLDGVRILREDTVAQAIGTVTPGQFDSTFGFPMRYGLGMMMGGDRFSLFGLTTRGAFGHLGFSNVVVYADPARQLAVSFQNTGKPMAAPGMVVWYWVLQRLALSVPRNR